MYVSESTPNRLSLFMRHSRNSGLEFLWHVCMGGWSKMWGWQYTYNSVRKPQFFFQPMWLLVDSIFQQLIGWSRWVVISIDVLSENCLFTLCVYRLTVQKIFQLTFIELVALHVLHLKESRFYFLTPQKEICSLNYKMPRLKYLYN